MECPCHEGVFDAAPARCSRAHRSGRSGASTSRCATAPSGRLGEREPIMTRSHRDPPGGRCRPPSACSSSCSLSLQVFLLTVGVDALLADDAGLAWVAAGCSAVLAAGSALFARYVTG